MFLSEELQKKWAPVIEHPDLGEIKDPHRRAVTATLLENQEIAAREGAGGTGGYQEPTLLGEAAPTNATGSNIDNFDPVLISLVRRSMPNLIAYDVAGVQPMTGPTGLIFAMRPQYKEQAGTEALYNEAITSFAASANNDSTFSTRTPGRDQTQAGATVQTGSDPTARASGSGYTVTPGMATNTAEALGDAAGNHFSEMAFSIEKISVTAVSRALKA